MGHGRLSAARDFRSFCLSRVAAAKLNSPPNYETFELPKEKHEVFVVLVGYYCFLKIFKSLFRFRLSRKRGELWELSNGDHYRYSSVPS